MSMWEELEEYLFDHDLAGSGFNSLALAEDWGIDGRRATAYIQRYLEAQVRSNVDTLYVLRRIGRTSSTVWFVGVRASDAHDLARQTADDMMRRFNRYVRPTLESIAAHNPRALRRAEGVAKAIEGGILLMASMLDGDG